MDFRNYMVEDWGKTIHSQYGAAIYNHSGDIAVVCNPVRFKSPSGPVEVQGSQRIELLTDFSIDDPPERKLRIRLVGGSAEQDRDLPADGHGHPNPAAGRTLIVDKKTYLYMIQPGTPAAASDQQGGSFPGLPG